MRISDWSSDVCSSDLLRFCQGARDSKTPPLHRHKPSILSLLAFQRRLKNHCASFRRLGKFCICRSINVDEGMLASHEPEYPVACRAPWHRCRSEEHTSELQSLMLISYAVFCLKKKKQKQDVVSKLTRLV